MPIYCKEFLIKLLYPNKRWTVLCILLSVLFMFCIYKHDLTQSPFAPTIYALSFYSLMITLLQLHKRGARIRTSILNRGFVIKYTNDIQLRMKLRLYSSVCINMLYACFKLLTGFLIHSIWEMHVGMYYLMLSVIRVNLSSHFSFQQIGKNKELEIHKYRLCGYCLIILNLLFSGEVILMVCRKYTYVYPGYMIYVAVMYAFYAIINAGINIIRYRKYDSPIINAANIICFITALVSMFSLQTAMLTQFGEHSLHENQMVNALTGSIISITILTITIFMVYTSKKKLKKYRK